MRLDEFRGIPEVAVLLFELFTLHHYFSLIVNIERILNSNI